MALCDSENQVTAVTQEPGEDLSVEECERLVLSPPPVPMDLHMACDAIYAAARRSNSSRTHSIHTQPTDGLSDGSNHPSSCDVRKTEPEHFPSFGKTRNAQPQGWVRLLCCFSDRSSPKTDHRKSAPPSKEGERVHPNHITSFHQAARTPPKSMKKTRLWTFRKNSIPKMNDCGCSKVPGSHWTDPHPDFDKPSLPPFRPALPNSVLRALSSDRTPPTSSCNIPVIVTDVPTSANGASSHPVNVAPKKGYFSSVLPRFPGFKHTPPDASRTGKELLVSADSGGDKQVLESSNEVAVEQYTSRANHIQGLVGGDVVDHSPMIDLDQHVYHVDVDQNGGQGDSSENLETLTPGVDLLGDLPPDCANKKCLVIDLDETLVHSWFKYVENASFVVPVELDGTKHQIYVCKRPHLDEFLRAVGPLFECVMFTASLRKYADPVCDYIDEASYFRHRLFREACVEHQNNLIKDLSRLGRDIDQICILDNSPVSFLFQPNNALQIVSWFDDPNDRALLELIPYFQGLAQSATVVDYLREFSPPASAAVAQPPTPAWFFPFDTGSPHDLDDSDGPDHLEDVGYEYSEEEEAVLSPHFHPPVPGHSANASALVRSYLIQLDLQPSGPLIPHRTGRQTTAGALSNSFISQLVPSESQQRNSAYGTCTTAAAATVISCTTSNNNNNNSGSSGPAGVSSSSS